MAVEIDVFGSCVCRDIFRYTQPGKYKMKKSIGYIPITSLYETPVQLNGEKTLEKLNMNSYEKLMLKVQAWRNLPQLMLKNKANILVLDLADEFMTRWQLDIDGFASIAVIEGKEAEYEKLFQNLSYDIRKKISPLDLDWKEVEKSFKRFSQEILYSEKNPNGYREKNIIIIESLYTPDILGNDGNIHKHDSRYKLHEYNEWLRKAYLIFYKYFQNSTVIKLPEFTHSSQNHLRGTHPLHYMQDTYFYFERALDVLCGYSQINTVENLFREQSLKNRLETRIVHSSMMYNLKNSVSQLKKDLGVLQNEISSKVKNERLS